MTNCHSTAYVADLENLPLNPIARIAEEEGEYKVDKPTPTAIRLSSKELQAYLRYRLEQHRDLPNRIHMQMEDLDNHLEQREEIDIFDLLVEYTLIGDEAPAQVMTDLMAVLDDDALLNLESRTIRHAGEFVRDVLKQKTVRRHLRHYHEEHEPGEGSEE